jgi:hypothetical protein
MLKNSSFDTSSPSSFLIMALETIFFSGYGHHEGRDGQKNRLQRYYWYASEQAC